MLLLHVHVIITLVTNLRRRTEEKGQNTTLYVKKSSYTDNEDTLALPQCSGVKSQCFVIFKKRRTMHQ